MSISVGGRSVKPPARRRGGSSLSQAVWAADRGLAVLEIVRNTKCPARKWKDLGYRSPGELETGWIRKYDVGVMCGPSDVVDVEVDGVHGEAILESAGLDLPRGCFLEIVTRSKSHHRVYQAKGTRFKSHRLLSDDCRPKSCGVDVKAWGGYFLLFADDREVIFYG